MRAYKGFNRNDDGTLSCLGFVYEPGKTYKHEGEIELCGSGFHACYELWQTWVYYPNNGNNEFWEVECGGDMIEDKYDNGKFVCSEITLVKKICMGDVAMFDNALYFSDGFAVVRLGGKCNFINKDGKVLSKKWFDRADSFSEGLAPIVVCGKYNFIDTEGKIKLGQWFDDAWRFSEGFAVVKLNRKRNFISPEGKILSKKWFDYAFNFSEGFAVVELDGKSNFINTEGKILSERWFDDAYDFCGGLANVKIDGNWTKINTQGELITY